MAETQRLQFILDAVDNTEKALSSVKNNFKAVQESTKNITDGLKTVSKVSAVAFAGISAGVLKSVSDFGEAERSQRQLEHAIIDVSHGTAEQVRQVNDLTSALQAKVGVDADALNMGVAQLSTFGLQSESVVNLTKSLADLTVNQSGVNASSDQYVTSANTIAKALNGQFGILEKSGIRFTELQKQMILTGTETEKVSALQEGLAQNLRETTDTLGGVDVAFARAKGAMGELSEAIGKAMAPVVEKIVDKFTDIITKVTEWISENPKLTRTIIIIAGAVTGLVAVLAGLTAVMIPLALAMTLVSLPILGIILLIGALIALVVVVITHWQMLVDFFSGLWEEIKAIFFGGIDAMIQFFVNAMTVAIEFIMAIVEQIKAIFLMVVQFVVNLWTSILMAVINFAKVILDAIIKWATDIKDNIVSAFTTVRDFFLDIWTTIVSAVSNAVGKIKAFLEPIIKMIERVIGGLKQIGDLLKGGKGGGGKDKPPKKVNDAIITPGGRVIQTHPDDFIMAMKNPGALAGAGGGITLNVTGNSFMGEEGVAEKLGNQLIKIIKSNMRI